MFEQGHYPLFGTATQYGEAEVLLTIQCKSSITFEMFPNERVRCLRRLHPDKHLDLAVPRKLQWLGYGAHLQPSLP